MMTTIVFSKDRAMQLDAFLRSYERHVTPLDTMHVSWRSSSLRHALAYREVFERHQRIVAHPQVPETFKQDVIDLLDGRTTVFFVDDIVFVRPWAVLEAPGLSLRLGLHLTRCYPTNSPQPLPPHWMLPDGRIRWVWGQGSGDWGYPLSIDGHVFDTVDLRRMLSLCEFNSPNTLEAALQAFVWEFKSASGTCYREAKIVNVPWNLVQTDWTNRSGQHYTADSLLEAWESGRQIAPLDGVMNESAHQEFPLELETRA